MSPVFVYLTIPHSTNSSKDTGNIPYIYSSSASANAIFGSYNGVWGNIVRTFHRCDVCVFPTDKVRPTHLRFLSSPFHTHIYRWPGPLALRPRWYEINLGFLFCLLVCVPR